MVLAQLVLLWSVIGAAAVAATGGSYVTSVTPNSGSRNGGTRITIYGTGFSADQFSYGTGNENLGNRVTLVSATQEYEAIIHVDGCRTTQIMAYTPQPLPADDYYVRVWVDGERIPDGAVCNGNQRSQRCTFTSGSSHTPTIDILEPSSGAPGLLVTMTGRLITDLYGADRASSTNGRTEQLKRAYVGGSLCDPMNQLGVDNPDEDDELYGFRVGTLRPEDPDYGYLTCRMTSRYVGNMNVSYIVGGAFGRSLPSLDTLIVRATNETSMLQTYAEIHSVTPSQGSIAGGTKLTIRGNSFDETNDAAKVTIAGEMCEVKSINDDVIICVAPAMVSNAVSNAVYQGNRGIVYERFGVRGDGNMTTESPSSGYTAVIQDMDSSLADTGIYDVYVEKMTGFFLAPQTTTMRFNIMGDDDAVLYISESGDPQEKVAVGNSGQPSPQYQATAGQPYYLEAEHMTSSYSGIPLRVGVTFEETVYTEAHTGQARNEKQVLATSSTQHPEIQTVVFEAMSPDLSSFPETQHLFVTSQHLDSVSFRIGLYGVYTGLLSGDAGGAAVAHELSALPSIAPDTVGVSVNYSEYINTTTNITYAVADYTITLNSERGDWDELVAVLDEDTTMADAEFEVQELKRGRNDGRHMAVGYGGRYTRTLTINSTASEIRSAVADLFSVQCPSTLLTSTGGQYYFNDFETSTSDIMPFCGHGCSKNNAFLYRGTDIYVNQGRWVCFAYLGAFTPLIMVKYSYLGETDVVYSYVTLGVELPETTGWDYTCVEMYEAIQARHPLIHLFKLTYIKLYPGDTGQNFYVDAVSIQFKRTIADVQGLVKWMRGVPDDWTVGAVDVDVASEDERLNYTVTLYPLNCAHDFLYFTLNGASGTVSGSEIVYQNPDWGQDVNVRVSRTQAASPPVTGTMDVEFEGISVSGIAANSSAADLKAQLETAPNMGVVDVTRSGDCSGYTWAIEWKTKAGNHDQMTLLSSTDLHAIDVESHVATTQDGGLYIDVIRGDMLRTVHDDPQVSVTINRIPSHCTQSCSFQWLQSATPSCTEVTPTSGSSLEGSVLTVVGTLFSSTLEDNTVTIGGVECAVVAATDTEIQCVIGQGPAGTYDVIVSVVGLGTAEHPNGGTVLSLTGSGFGDAITITLGPSECTILSVEYSTVTCVTPSQGSESTVGLTVMEGVNSVNGAVTFTYVQSSTPIVTSISESSVLVQGGQTVTIAGTLFGSPLASPASVSVNGASAIVTSQTDSQLLVVMPDNPPGDYRLRVTVSNLGNADIVTNSVPDIRYNFFVTNLYPSFGSIHGGTLFTITGAGFSEQTTVTLGQVACEMESVSESVITCLSGTTTTIHSVTNQGIHPDYGVGYQWSDPHLTIGAGDGVLWTWTTYVPCLEEDECVTYSVQQVNSSTAIYSFDGGFSSARSSKGSYFHVFTETGIYYYTAGQVDPTGLIQMRGTVVVQETQGVAVYLQVTDSGYEALYDTNSGVSEPMDSSLCMPLSSPITGCTQPVPTTNDPSLFAAALYSCYTPTVTSWGPSNGTTSTTITITGEGFSADPCQSEVYLGDCPCIIMSSSDTEVTCTLSDSCASLVATPLPFSLRINNRGWAALQVVEDAGRYFTLLPEALSISPEMGSMEGGTQLTITGSGFPATSSLLSVQIDGFECSVVSSSYTEVICTSPSSSWEHSAVITMSVLNGDVSVPVITTATFSYQEEYTPTVLSLDPNVISEIDTIITIHGNHFGSNFDDVIINIGVANAVFVSGNDTEVVARLSDVVVGTQDIYLNIPSRGIARSAATSLEIEPIIVSVHPNTGSLAGGQQVTIIGLGFHETSTIVSIDGAACSIVAISPVEIILATPPGTEGWKDVLVSSAGILYPTHNYTYATDHTPVMSSIDPSIGQSGTVVTITGEGFGADLSVLDVHLGATECIVTDINDTVIICTTGDHEAATLDISIHVAQLGYASGTLQFQYQLLIDSLSLNEGSYGGGLHVTITGQGFAVDDTEVTVCGEDAQLIQSSSSSHIVVAVPSQPLVDPATVCDMTVRVGERTAVLTESFTYRASLTPSVTTVTPQRGGTGGGTRITIEGTGFGDDSSHVLVSIAGTACAVDSVNDSTIICATGAHRPAETAHVQVHMIGKGAATPPNIQSEAQFQYIDLWSSPYTWGNELPAEDDFIIIPAGQTVALDTVTPRLKLLLIQGGQLVFDDNQDVELHADFILITDGGALKIGSEESRFQHSALIKMHGHIYQQELPIYGVKTLAVRHGQLEIHGQHKNTMWTLLADDAAAGDSIIHVQHPVDWNIGDKFVITSTGDHLSQNQNEVHIVVALSEDGRTITIQDPLQYDHLGSSLDIDGVHTLEARAEVGLLSQNVKFQGHDDPEWNEDIESCTPGFDPGEFAVQTCFQGRAGNETESSQFGGAIMFHQPQMDSGLAEAHIQNMELSYVGQAFRLGRYPIHFHMNGDMGGSYVRGCSIHNSFNRAINIHNTNNVLITGNVIYDIMGGAFFLEDGIETGNIFSFNLAVFVRASTSLQNDDITPAAFWVTNPNNTVVHNHVGGGTHFGFWYRMHEHPDGPSFDSNICQRRHPLGQFYNNTAHSLGWYGVWIFPIYQPTLDGGCESSNYAAARFEKMTAWNCQKGVEFVEVGAVQLHDFLLVSNNLAGVEIKLITDSDPFSESTGPLLKNGVIASRTMNDLLQGPTATAVKLPYSRGLFIKNVIMVNFDGTSYVITLSKIQGMSGRFNGGFRTRFEDIQFVNSGNKARLEWEHQVELEDADGSLTGSEAGSRVVASTGILPPEKCHEDISFSQGVPASVCSPDVRFHRYSFNLAVPQSLEGADVILTNEYGTSRGHFVKERITHPMGWQILIVSGMTYQVEFESHFISNISYVLQTTDYEAEQSIILQYNITQAPDRVWLSTQPGTNIVEMAPEMVSLGSYHGEWYYDNVTRLLSVVYSHRQREEKRSTGNDARDYYAHFMSYNCFYPNCVRPLLEDTPPPSSVRPDNFSLWSNEATWHDWQKSGIPQDYDDVTISADKWVVLDISVIVSELHLYGTLEFEDNGAEETLSLSATHIVIMSGRFIIGWPDSPYEGWANIVLRGNRLTTNLHPTGAPVIGAKAIGVFGGLDLFGRPHTLTWTRLAETELAGSNRLVLDEDVDWTAGDEILLTTSSYTNRHTEIRTIVSVTDSRILVLNESLHYNHIVSLEVLCSAEVVYMGAEVGLLTRNIKIIGEEYPQLYEHEFGGRVLVGALYSEFTSTAGYARLNNVEFVNMGQYGFTEEWDPRYALAFLDVGDVTEGRPSVVQDCAFHHGFAPAIGVYGTNHLLLQHNIIHRPVGAGIVTNGYATSIYGNLVVDSLWAGTFNDRREQDFKWQAGIEVNDAQAPVLKNNVVAGCERFGYRVDGEVCEVEAAWSNNIAHGTLIGVAMLGDGLESCSRLSGFIIYKAYDCGVYVQSTTAHLVVDHVTVVDSCMALYPMLVQPSAQRHQYEHKKVTITNSSFVGRSHELSCENDRLTNSLDHLLMSANSRPFHSPTGGCIGVSIGTFSSNFNNAPVKPFYNIMTYPALFGETIFENLCFSKYGSGCAGEDVAIVTPQKNDDAIHPTFVSGLQFQNTDVAHRVFFYEPDLRKINPSDCVDMDCDGHKKILLTDQDGSLLEQPGALLARSEFEWDGDPRRGLGDYRIPAAMLTNLDGSRIEADQIAPYKGIVRDDSCVFSAAWNAWKCWMYSYAMLVVESMDSDTETRRLSPVALLVEEYVDLVNGPQDHGWCTGYTCQKRLSTFNFIVAHGKTHKLYFSSTSPQSVRYHLLNSDDNEAVVIATWYSIRQRLDVYKNGIYILPQNGHVTSSGLITFTAPSYDGEYLPDAHHYPGGANYFDVETGLLYVVVCGRDLILVRTSPVIRLSFGVPTVDIDDFYGENLASNLATFLDIPGSNILIVNIVSESRRKRNTVTESFQMIQVEIASPPEGSHDGDALTLTLEHMQTLASVVINAAQFGTLGDILGIEIVTLNVEEPLPAPGSEQWAEVAAVLSEVTSGAGAGLDIMVPDSLVIQHSGAAFYEGVPFGYSLEVYLSDQYGLAVGNIGSRTSPWRIQVELTTLSGTDHSSRFEGTSEQPIRYGVAAFEDLVITHFGSYSLSFTISTPAEARDFIESEILIVVVLPRPLTATILSHPEVTWEGDTFSLDALLLDDLTGGLVDDLHWRNLSWVCSLSLYMSTLDYLGGVTELPLDGGGSAQFSAITLSQKGRYFIEVRFWSEGGDYDIRGVSGAIDVYPVAYVEPEVATAVTVQLSFEADYNTTVLGREEYFSAVLHNHLLTHYTQEVIYNNYTLSPGSILVNMRISGGETDLDSVVENLWSDIQSGLVLQFGLYNISANIFLRVDGVHQTPNSSQEIEMDLLIYIIVGVVGSIIFVVILATACMLLLKKKHEPGTRVVRPMLSSRSELCSRASSRNSALVIDDMDLDLDLGSTLNMKQSDGFSAGQENLTVSETGMEVTRLPKHLEDLLVDAWDTPKKSPRPGSPSLNSPRFNAPRSKTPTVTVPKASTRVATPTSQGHLTTVVRRRSVSHDMQ